MRCAIFPGHVGRGPGAIDGLGPDDNIYSVEAEITRTLSSKVCRYLKDLGVDHTMAIGSFKQRVQDTLDCTVGLSIHVDSHSNQSLRGFHCIYYPGSQQGRRLASCVDKSLSVRLDRRRKPHARRDLYILRKTAFPTVLVECGFLSNVIEEAWLQSEDNQYNIAFSLVAGLREWMYGAL